MPGPTDMAVVPSVANAPLPARYEQARAALAECSAVDECKDWADKAQALASYARQADDDALFKLATRIQARAIRRAGELLKQFQGPPGPRPAQEIGEGDHHQLPRTQREAAEAAGMSAHQEKQAVRVSNVPQSAFEAAVESESPPTVTALAEMGKQPRPTPDDPAYQPKPKGFYEATHTMGALRRFVEKCRDHPPELVAGGLDHHEHDEARELVAEADAWLDRFVVNIGRRVA